MSGTALAAIFVYEYLFYFHKEFSESGEGALIPLLFSRCSLCLIMGGYLFNFHKELRENKERGSLLLFLAALFVKVIARIVSRILSALRKGRARVY